MAIKKKKPYGTRLDKFQEAIDNSVKVVEVDGKKVSDVAPVKTATRFIDLAPSDIAPIKTSTKKATNTSKNESTWLSKGAFDDGYQFGDITKSILGTTAELNQKFLQGGLSIGESAIDAGAYLVGKTADLFGADNFANSTSKFIAKDIIDEEKIATVMNSVNPATSLNYWANRAASGKLNPFEADTEEIYKNSFMGEELEGLAQSGGQLAATIGLQAVGVPWQVTSGITSFGSEAENAFKNDATYNEAGFSAAVSAGAEILTNSMFKIPGIKASGSGKVGNKLLNTIAGKMSDTTVRNMANWGINIVGEGAEETITSFFQRLGQGLSYEREDTLKELAESEEARNTYVNQMAEKLFGEEARKEYFNSFIGGAALSSVAGAPNTYKMTKQGRDINTGYTQNEQTVIDSLVNEQTNEIAKKNALENELNKAIESKEAEQGGILSDKEKNALKSKIEAQIANGELDISSTKVSNKDISKIREAVEENMQKGLLDTNTIESVLGKADLSKDSYLQKSYIETVKRKEAFTYENEITDAKEKAVYDSATKYFNNTTRSHEFVDRVAKISKEKGTNYGFINNEELQSLGHDVEGKQVNGLVRTNKDGKQTVLINIDSPKALETIVGHETTHLLEGTQEYQDLQDAIFNYAKEKGDFDARQKSLNSLYEGIENANVDSELTADLVGDYLFTDTDFINSLSTQKPTVFQRIKELIDDLVVRFTGTKEEKALREVQKKFKEAYRQNAQSTKDTQYSLSDGKIQGLENYSIDEIKQLSKEYIKQTLEENDLYDVNIKDIAIHGSRGRGTARADSDLDIVVEYEGDIREDDLFNALNEDPMFIEDIQVDINPITESLSDYMARSDAYDKEVLAKQNTKYSLTDNQGRTLTQEQQERFKYSKIRNENGSLKVMYHGTQRADRVGTLFDPNRATSGPMAFFTDNYEVAENYSKDKDDTSLSREYDTEYDLFKVDGKDLDTYWNSLSKTEQQKINEEGNNIGFDDDWENIVYGKNASEDSFSDMYKWYLNNQEKGNGIKALYDVWVQDGNIMGEDLYKFQEVLEKAGIKDVEFLDPYKVDRKVYEVYLNITNPFDTSNMPEDIINQFKEASKTATIGEQYSADLWDKSNIAPEDWIAKLQDDLENGTAHAWTVIPDWVTNVLKANGYDGIVDVGGKNGGETHQVVIPFYSEQIKDINNINPTDNPNIDLSLSQQNEIPTKNPNLTYSEDIKLQVEEAIAPLQEQINELTEQLTNNTTDNVKVPVNQNTEEIAPIAEVEYTQPTKAELDNLMALQETGGTEYANTFFGLRDKYGQRNLYKGINEYKKAPNTYEAPIKNDEFAPTPQEIVEQQNQEAFNNIDESNMPSEAEDTTPDVENEVTDTKSLFETRSYEDVGNRKVNAYQYDNPEVKPYFQEAAQQMLYDLDNSIKGERIYNDEAYYNSNGETGWYGTTRQTAADIAELLDGVDGKYKLSYENIRKGLNAIIKDEGSENNAASKRIEFYLDQRLREGYTTVDDFEVPANQEYLDMISTQATNGEDVTDYYNNIPITDDLAPVENVNNVVDNVSNSESIAPVKEKYEAIRPAKEPKMVRVKEPQKLGKVEGRVTKPTEPELINGAKQQTLEGTEEDLYTKTKKELRRDLIEPNKEFLISALDNAKNRSMALMNNTDTIRNTELVFGREAGKMINDSIFQKEIDNEADSIAWQNKERQEIKDLGIKARSKESAAVQKYGEKQWVNETGEVLKYGDAELRAEFKDVDTQERIKQAAQVIRNKYDNYIDEANNVLTKLGFEPIKKRTDYMRHFQELNDVFTRYGIPFNAQNMQEHVLPTDINGLTEFWSPQKNYFANMQPRKGIKTTYDAITGVDGYISGISNLIFHTEDIQRGRAFEELIRETYGESKGWENLEKLPDELKQARAEKIQDNHLSNYAAWLHEWTNNIAGKKNKIDRSVESMFGRKAFSFLDNVKKQVGSNMIGFNVSSSLTNLIAPAQAMAKTNKLAVAKGTADTIKNIFIKDNFMDNNKFLTSRMGTDMISKNAWQKMQDAGFVFMKGMDWFSSNQIVRSKYYELRAKGMSEEQAHAEAGQFAARIMSDRTKGAAPQIYNSKMLGLITQFQQEVNNQLYSTFYDTYQESKENAKGNALKTAAGMTFTLGQLFAFTHLFGKTFESIAGYNPTFDVVEIIKTAFGWGEGEDDEKTTSERLKNAADMLVDALPYVNILTGGGRIPVASGIPNLVGVATGGTDQYGNELTLEDEMKKLLYLIPPTGGNQFKKTTQGLSMFDEDLPVTGSYTDSGNLRFPVEDTLGNKAQAALFGQYASKNAGVYFDEERSPLKEKQIQEYADLELPIREYWDYRDGLKGLNTLEEKFEYVNDLDVTDEQKNIMINNIVDREEKVDMSNYDDYGSYEEFDFAIKNEEKYNFLQENNIPYSDYVANDNSKEAYNWAYNNPEKYSVSKAVTDNVVRYRQYKGEIYDIEADKDSSGKSISGSRKEKVISYVNSLDLTIPQKAILIRQEYSTFDDYNNEIVEYVGGLDISYDEMKTILEELDMTVKDGRVYWE